MTELLQLIAELETFARDMRSESEFIRTPPLTREEIAVVASYRRMMEERDEDRSGNGV